METASCMAHYDAILQFLKSDPKFSFSPLFHVADKLKLGHTAYGQTKILVDSLTNIGVVVGLFGDSISGDPISPDVSFVGIETKDDESIKDIHRLIAELASPTVKLACCLSSVVSNFSNWEGHSLVRTIPISIFFRRKSVGEFECRKVCPPGYDYRRANADDAAFFYSTWKFSSGEMTPFVADRFENLLRHLPSIVVTTDDKEEEGKETIVGCCMQSDLGCICKLFVDDRHRRRGIGAFIVDELARQIEDEGNTLPPYAHIEDDNDASMSLFQKLGFTKWNFHDKRVWSTMVDDRTT